jgi:hypothetical protein
MQTQLITEGADLAAVAKRAELRGAVRLQR